LIEQFANWSRVRNWAATHTVTVTDGTDCWLVCCKNKSSVWEMHEE